MDRLFENRQCVKFRNAQQAFVKEYATQTNYESNDNYNSVIVDGQKGQVGELEDSRSAEKCAGDYCRRHCCCHTGKQYYDGKVAVQFFQSKNYASKWSVKGCSQTCTGTAGHKVTFFHTSAFEHSAYALGCYGTKLNGGTLATKGKTSANTQDACG